MLYELLLLYAFYCCDTNEAVALMRFSTQMYRLRKSVSHVWLTTCMRSSLVELYTCSAGCTASFPLLNCLVQQWHCASSNESEHCSLYGQQQPRATAPDDVSF
jgi:hypothetical protein